MNACLWNRPWTIDTDLVVIHPCSVGTILLAIDAAGLTKSYGDTRAVDGIDLAIESGTVFGFLGPNGAGKSTTIKMLTTLIPPTSGSLKIFGMDALSRSLEVRKRIGVVLQQSSYEPSLSVERSLDTYGMMWDVPRDERRKRTASILAEFGLEDIRKKNMEDISIGQRRRVQVAREFMHDMDMLFLDEATVGLDPAARRGLLDYVKAKADSGLTILYTTHILSEAEYICDNIAIINNGSIIALNTPDELKKMLGGKKTITVHTKTQDKRIPNILEDTECDVSFGLGTDVTICSRNAEDILLDVLKRLSDHGIRIENLAVAPVSLEDIFLELVKSNASNN